MTMSLEANLKGMENTGEALMRTQTYYCSNLV